MSSNQLAIAPLAILFAGLFATYLVGRTKRIESPAPVGAVGALSTVGALGVLSVLARRPLPIEYSLVPGGVGIRVTALGLFLSIVACLVGTAVSIFGMAGTDTEGAPEIYFPLVIASIAGVVGIGMSADLFTLYVFFEIMAIATYALVPFAVTRASAVEAGMKIVVMNVMGSLLAIFGISLMYAQTGGVLDIATLSGVLSATGSPGPMEAAILFLVVGFGVKAAIVPIHTWLPDAHSEAPAGASPILSGLVTPVAAVAMVKALSVFPLAETIGLMLVVFGGVSMSFGNFLALGQRDLKRLLAYSSVAHTGYILFGFGIGLYGGLGVAFEGALFHVLANSLMKVVAFLAVGAIAYRVHQTSIAEYRNLDELAGVGYQMPIASGAVAVAVLALAGVPPLAGFWGKLLIVIGSADISGPLGLGLALLIIGNSFLSLGYYLPVLGQLFATPSDEIKTVEPTPSWTAVPIIGLTAGTILLGLSPGIGLDLVAPAAEVLQHGPGVIP